VGACVSSGLNALGLFFWFFPLPQGDALTRGWGGSFLAIPVAQVFNFLPVSLGCFSIWYESVPSSRFFWIWRSCYPPSREVHLFDFFVFRAAVETLPAPFFLFSPPPPYDFYWGQVQLQRPTCGFPLLQSAFRFSTLPSQESLFPFSVAVFCFF